MTPDTIAGSAEGMIRNFGRDALALADAMTRKFDKAGDGFGCLTWKRIASAIRKQMADQAVVR